MIWESQQINRRWYVTIQRFKLLGENKSIFAFLQFIFGMAWTDWWRTKSGNYAIEWFELFMTFLMHYFLFNKRNHTVKCEHWILLLFRAHLQVNGLKRMERGKPPNPVTLFICWSAIQTIWWLLWLCSLSHIIIE